MSARRDGDEENRAALLTAAAPGAIAVIGLRGAGTGEILRRILRGRGDGGAVALREGRYALCRVVDGEEVLDEALVVSWDGGRAAEISVHGGMRIVQRVMLLLERHGCRRVEPDELAADDAEDEVTREVDRALRTASTRRMARWLLAQRRLLPGWMAAAQAGAATISDDVIQRARAARRLVDGARVAIVGPPNAGKSTLANRLIGHERVVTSDQPGTTRDWVSETAVVRGWPVTLTDTAGIRATGDAIERESIRRGVSRAKEAALALIVLDGGRPEAERRAAEAAISATVGADAARLVVLNKVDLLAGSAGRTPPGMIGVSALRGDGMDELEAALAAALGLDLLDEEHPAPFTARQFRALGLPL